MTECIDRLHQAIDHVQPDAHLENLDVSYFPLMLLLSGNGDIVAFGKLERDSESASWRKALSAFRVLYAERAKGQERIEPILVLCTRDEWDGRALLVSEVETDPYFCRKFVIRLDADLEAQLQGLPFVPVEPMLQRSLIVPPASVIIAGAGISPRIANEFAEPVAAATKRIADRLLASSAPNAAQVTVRQPYLDVAAEGQVSARTRIGSVRIRNFRAYGTEVAFDVDADVVVLYGPNGLGKTSFFDAIDFACTAGVARFIERYPHELSRLPRLLRHLDSSGESSFVELRLRQGDKSHSLRRDVDDPANAQLDGHRLKRTSILLSLTGLGHRTSDIRIQNLVRLFSATHVFGQEFQALTDRVRHDSVLDETVVSRLLALEDYVRSSSRIHGVLLELQDRSRTSRSQIEGIEAREQEARARLRKYKPRVGEPLVPKEPASLTASIVKEVNEVLGTSSEPPDSSNVTFVRHLRAEVTGHQQATANLQKQCRQLLRQVESIRQLSSQVVELQNRIDAVSQTASSLDQRHEALSSLLDEHEGHINEANAEWAHLSERRQHLCWAVEAAKKRRTLQSSLRSARVRLAEIERSLTVKTAERDVVMGRLEDIQRSLVLVRVQSERVSARVSTLQRLKHDFSEWQEQQQRVANGEREMAKLVDRIGRTQARLQVLRNSLSLAEGMARTLSDEAAEGQRALGLLRAAIDRLLQRDIGACCPVCGTVHATSEDLRRRILEERESARQVAGPKSQAMELALLEVGRLSRDVSRLEHVLEERQARHRGLVSMRQTASDATAKYEVTAREVGVEAINSSALAESSDLANRRLASVANRALALQECMSTLATQAAALQSSIAQMDDSRASCEDAIRQCEGAQEQLLFEASTWGVSDISSVTAARRELSGTRKQLAGARANQADAARAREALSRQESALRREMETVSGRLERLVAKRARLEDRETLLRPKCDSVDLPFPPDSGQILARMQSLDERWKRLGSIRDRLVQLEVYLDSVQRLAVVAEAEDALARCQCELATWNATRRHLDAWTGALAGVEAGVALSRDNVVAKFAEEYGPAVTKLERRLRVVPGFDRITLRPEKGGLAVYAHRAGESPVRVPPSDYFSSSQMQVLVLCLFLTASLSQSWSAFAPVLMDDPVVHFDDMNSYALVDLLHSLVSHSKTGRQFFVSTCDYDFFQLALERLRPLGSRARFIEFTALGKDGPQFAYVGEHRTGVGF